MGMFSYNCQTGNIMRFESRIVRYDLVNGKPRFWYKDKGCRWFLLPFELEELKKLIRWLVEERGCDFGEAVNNFAKEEQA